MRKDADMPSDVLFRRVMSIIEDPESRPTDVIVSVLGVCVNEAMAAREIILATYSGSTCRVRTAVGNEPGTLIYLACRGVTDQVLRSLSIPPDDLRWTVAARKEAMAFLSGRRAEGGNGDREAADDN